MRLKSIFARAILVVYFAALLLPTALLVVDAAVSDHYDVVVDTITFKDGSDQNNTLWWHLMNEAFARVGTIDVEVSDDGIVSFTIPPVDWALDEDWGDSPELTRSFKGATFRGTMNRDMSEGEFTISAPDGSYLENLNMSQTGYTMRAECYDVTGTAEIHRYGVGEWDIYGDVTFTVDAISPFYKDGLNTDNGYTGVSYTVKSAEEADSASTEDALVYVVAGGIALVGLGGGVAVIRLLLKKLRMPKSAKISEPKVESPRKSKNAIQQTPQEAAPPKAQSTAQQANPPAQSQAPAQAPQPDIPISAADYLGGPGDNPNISFEDVTTCNLS